jgi:hypothetical protein
MRRARAPVLAREEQGELQSFGDPLIPQRVDPSTGLPATVSPAWIYSRNQLTETGRQPDLGAALRSLDPSITP